MIAKSLLKTRLEENSIREGRDTAYSDSVVGSAKALT